MATERFYPGTLANQQSIISKLDAIAADVGDLKGVSITVTAQTRDSVTVTGQVVYLYEGDDATGLLVQQFAYNGQPVTFNVRKGFHYFIKMSSNLAGHHSPNTVSGVANAATSVVITYEDVSTITTFAAVKAFLDQLTGTLEERVAAGRVALVDDETPIEIVDTWTTEEGATIDDPMVIVDVKAYEGEDLQMHVGVKVQRKYATVEAFSFDAPNKQEATETTAQAGVYYIGASATNTLTKLNLAEGATIPYSDYAHVYKNKYNDTNIVNNGHNRYETSAWRQYLNSSADIGEWWTRMHDGQMPPDGLTTTRGYLAGCSEALLAAAKKVKINVAANTGIDGGGIYPLVDLFWLSSTTEYNGSGNPDEGEVDKYWIDRMGGVTRSDAANTGRVQRKVTNKTGGGVTVWSRSALRGSSTHVWNVTSSGQVSNNNASNQYAGCPACVIY